MHSPLHRYLAQARAAELRRAGASSLKSRGPLVKTRRLATSPVTLRFAFPDDFSDLARLASLDSAALPEQPVLVAEVAGQLRAALSLADGAVIADPFYPSAGIVELLHARAAQLRSAERDSGRRSGSRGLARLRLRVAGWR